MKNKIILMISIILFSGFSVNAQGLANTSWISHDGGIDPLYFHFGTDTLTYSYDGIVYTKLSIYSESGNNFRIVDLPGMNCLAGDTGRYTFLIRNDSLKFTLVYDICTSRSVVLSGTHWTRNQTGIINTGSIPVVKLYPNPASDKIFIEADGSIQGTSYLFYDQTGREVMTGSLNEGTTSVDITSLSPGLYLFRLSDKRFQTIKVRKN